MMEQVKNTTYPFLKLHAPAKLLFSKGKKKTSLLTSDGKKLNTIAINVPKLCTVLSIK